MAAPKRFAFYDLDGTLVSTNVVHQYAWYARQSPSRLESWSRTARLLASAPLLIALEKRSRRKFNVAFYRAYRGMRRDWLESHARRLFNELFRPGMYPGAKALVDADKASGFETVLVTGSLDFAIGPLIEFFGFDHVITNRLVFAGGVATGEIEEPLIAEAEKVAAIERLTKAHNGSPASSKAYSDSLSDLPMLETVGAPSAVNPSRELRRIAEQRGWPILDLRTTNHE